MSYAYKKIKIFVSGITLFILPQLTFAAGLGDFVDSGYDLITNILIPLAFALCLLYFFWGVAKYIKNSASGNSAAEDAKKTILWGLIGVFIAFSIWGIIVLIRNELGIPDIQNVEKPGLIESADSNIIYDAI